MPGDIYCAYRADGADGAGDRGNTPGSSRLPGRGLEFEEHIEGQEHAEHVRRDLGPDQPVHPKEAVQEEQHGDVEAQPPDHPQEQGDPAPAEGLKQVDGEEAQEHQRRGQHPDPQELGGQLHGLLVPDEQVDELDGEQLVEQDADRGDHQSQPPGQADGVVHALLVPR